MSLSTNQFKRTYIWFLKTTPACRPTGKRGGETRETQYKKCLVPLRRKVTKLALPVRRLNIQRSTFNVQRWLERTLLNLHSRTIRMFDQRETWQTNNTNLQHEFTGVSKGCVDMAKRNTQIKHSPSVKRRLRVTMGQRGMSTHSVPCPICNVEFRQIEGDCQTYQVMHGKAQRITENRSIFE